MIDLKLWDYFERHFSEVCLWGAIMVSAIIVLIGLLKPFIFNKIKNNQLRKATLALSNVVSCFVVTMLKFLVDNHDFENYWVASLSLSVCCIITYWLYENTCLRNLISLIGKKTLAKVWSVVIVAATENDKDVKTEVEKAKVELKAHASNSIKEYTNDKDLKNL